MKYFNSENQWLNCEILRAQVFSFSFTASSSASKPTTKGPTFSFLCDVLLYEYLSSLCVAGDQSFSSILIVTLLWEGSLTDSIRRLLYILSTTLPILTTLYLLSPQRRAVSSGDCAPELHNVWNKVDVISRVALPFHSTLCILDPSMPNEDIIRRNSNLLHFQVLRQPFRCIHQMLRKPERTGIYLETQRLRT